MQTLKAKLLTGTISISSEMTSPKLEDLFDFAQRQNPNRAFLFVSKVLGKHIPIKPSIMRQSYRELAGKLPKNLPEPIVFIGLAETAVGLGAGIFEESLNNYSDALFINTTRHKLPHRPIFAEFKEEHSHATDHLIHEPDTLAARTQLINAKTLVIVDDEATTGKTFLNLYNGLIKAGLAKIETIVTITLTDWTDKAIPFNHKHLAISLIKGKWYFETFKNAPLLQMPSHTAKSKEGVAISNKIQSGRLGIHKPPLIENFILKINKKLNLNNGVDKTQSILVLGSSEFSYIPFLIAERLEKLGHNVKFSATTRSPIADGLAIKSSLKFNDNYGEGVSHYCYNVKHQHFDHIIFCVETSIDAIDATFLAALNQISPSITIFTI